MGHFQQVEEAWQLSDELREYGKNAGRELGPADYWTEMLSKSEQVDVERTTSEGGEPPTKVFLKTPYGLQWRTDYKDWIPFRHGPIDLNNV